MQIEYLTDHEKYIPTLAQWHHDQWSFLSPGKTLQDRIDKFHGHLSPQQVPTTFVALDESDLLGSASLVKHDMRSRMDLSPWLASVYVSAKHRRKGVGSKLVRRVIEEARRLGFAKFYLFTLDQDRLYESLGWKTIERTEYSAEQVVIMEFLLH